MPSKCPTTEPSVIGYDDEKLKLLLEQIRDKVGVKKERGIDVVSTNHFYTPFILLPSIIGHDTIFLS